MDRTSLLQRMFWHLETRWHHRHRPTADELSALDTVKGLQALFLADQGALLAQTLRRALSSSVALTALMRLDIALYQEGLDQRVWRAEARLTDGTAQVFGIITARTPHTASTLTQNDFRHLRDLSARQPRHCVQPFVYGTMPIAGGVGAFTVEWLDQYKEFVFEVARDGGVFLINAHGAQRVFSPWESRQIWRRLVTILWWYAGLRRVNIQAGDFVGRVHADGRVELKLTTARELVPDPGPLAHLHTILHSVITASGYLSDGRRPFDRTMPEAVFLHRMQAVLRRRFGNRAPHLARQQWVLFRQGAFARQEDWLKEDCILATDDFLRAKHPAARAWYHTCRRWQAYARAVRAGRLPPSWWFPAAEVPRVLDRLTRQQQSQAAGAASPSQAPPAPADNEVQDQERRTP
jgi:hypothetical protein